MIIETLNLESGDWSEHFEETTIRIRLGNKDITIQDDGNRLRFIKSNSCDDRITIIPEVSNVITVG